MKQFLIFPFKFSLLICIGLFLFISACKQTSPKQNQTLPLGRPESSSVKILNSKEGYTLFDKGKPFTIKGAVIGDSQTHLLSLANIGGNTVRTYTSSQAQSILDSAELLDLKVMLGLYLMPAEYGMDYGNANMVQQQQDSLLQIVRQWKNHPALLLWGLGNEVELHSSDPHIWPAINSLATAIHREDPDHPTASVILPNAKSLKQFIQSCPDVDILGINSFGSLQAISKQLLDEPRAWNGPILFTEWGVPGPWESPHTDWRAPIEWTPREKSYFLHQYGKLIQDELGRGCLGGFAFLWGHKMECTETWFSIFGKQGEQTAMFDQLKHLWTGSWPSNRAPIIDSLWIADSESGKQVYLQTGKHFQCKIIAHDPEGQALEYSWAIIPESGYPGFQSEMPDLPSFTSPPGGHPEWLIEVPRQAGAYRLSVVVRDAYDKISSANLPFFVTMQSPIHP